MSDTTYKAQLLAAGATEEQIAKIDFAKIESIAGGVKDMDEFCKEMKAAFPSFDEDAFRKAATAQSKDSEEAEDLSDDALESVAGGSLGSWLNKNKSWLIPLAGVAIVGAIYGGTKLFGGGSAAASTASSSAGDSLSRTSSISSVGSEASVGNYYTITGSKYEQAKTLGTGNAPLDLFAIDHN